MPQMKSLRTFRLASTTGHVVQFIANEARDVHPDLVQEAMAHGCVLVDPADQPFYDDLARAKVDFTGDIRKSMLYLAVKSLAEENDTRKFDAGGSPKAAVVGDMLGLTIGKREVNDMFQQYLTIRQDGGEFPLHPNAPNILRVIEAESGKELKELGEEFGVDEKSMDGMTVKELRRLLLVRLNGNAAG